MRVTRLSGIDLNRFTFDMDVTWNAFFTDANLNVYSRYGGRDGGEPDERMSVSSLLRTMDEVLAEHQRPSGRKRFQPRQPGRPRRRGAAARTEPVPIYAHLRAELRHIGLVAGFITALLIVLTVVLR